MEKKDQGFNIGRFLVQYTDFDNPVGSGAFSNVYLCSKQGETEKRYAAKQMYKRPEYQMQLDHEVKVSEEIHRTRPMNVIPIEEVIDTEDHVYIIMKLCNRGTLENYLQIHPLPTICEVQSLFKGIATGVANLHKLHIIHRDLKLENVFLHEDPDGILTPYIGDLGFAKLLAESQLMNEAVISGTILGTPLTMAPEILHTLLLLMTICTSPFIRR